MVISLDIPGQLFCLSKIVTIHTMYHAITPVPVSTIKSVQTSQSMAHTDKDYILKTNREILS